MKYAKLLAASSMIVATLVSITPANAMMLPSGPAGSIIQSELDHLIALSKANSKAHENKDTQDEIERAKNFMNDLAKNHHHFEVIRLNSFIPDKTVGNPNPVGRVLGRTFHGDDRGFDPFSVDCRTSQEIIVDLQTHQVETVNFVGESILYNSDRSVYQSGRAVTNGMSVKSSYDESHNQIHISASVDVGNPIEKGVFGDVTPKIEYDMEFTVQHAGSNYSLYYKGDIKHFPAYEMYTYSDMDPMVHTIKQFKPTTVWYPKVLQLYGKENVSVTGSAIKLN